MARGVGMGAAWLHSMLAEVQERAPSSSRWQVPRVGRAPLDVGCITAGMGRVAGVPRAAQRHRRGMQGNGPGWVACSVVQKKSIRR